MRRARGSKWWWLRESVAAIVTLAGSMPSHAQGGCAPDETILLPSVPPSFHDFGSAVALDGNLALVGSPLQPNPDGTHAAVAVWEQGDPGWQETALLTPDPGAVGADFGRSVALSGQTALVGFRFDDAQGQRRGCAYVFVRDAGVWSLQAKLLQPVADGNNYVCAVAIDGDVAVVGARRYTNPAGGWGTVFVFERSAGVWSLTAELASQPTSLFDDLGGAVAIDGDMVLAAALGADNHGPGEGLAFLFSRTPSGWMQTGVLAPTGGVVGDGFGWSVGLRDDIAVVGAPFVVADGSISGSIYCFRRIAGLWTQSDHILPTIGEPTRFFGGALSLSPSGESLVVGAYQDFHGGPQAGAAFQYVRSGSDFVGLRKLYASDEHGRDWFGWSVAASEDHLLVGAPTDPKFGSGTGSAYVYAARADASVDTCACPMGPCGNDDPDGGCANSLGQGAQLAARGRSSPDELHLLLSGALPGQPTVLFQGDESQPIPFGDGLRCARTNVVRLSPAPLVVDPDGRLGFGPCFGDPSISSITGVVPGSGITRWYQAAYRDASSPCSSGWNLSNATAVRW